MRVQPIGSTNYTRVQQCSIPPKRCLQSDRVSFSGVKPGAYEVLINKYVSNEFKNTSELAQGFEKLFSSIKNNNKIKKLPGFDFIENLYKQNGFRGMLHELWKANPSPEVKKAALVTFNNPITLAAKNGKPVMQLENVGPHGFWNYMKENHDAKRCFQIRFLTTDAKPKKAGFCIDKGGEYTFLNETSCIRYFNSTGTPKTRTILRSPREIIHYNEDGSRNFFKNLFFGGTEGADDLIV